MRRGVVHQRLRNGRVAVRLTRGFLAVVIQHSCPIIGRRGSSRWTQFSRDVLAQPRELLGQLDVDVEIIFLLSREVSDEIEASENRPHRHLLCPRTDSPNLAERAWTAKVVAI